MDKYFKWVVLGFIVIFIIFVVIVFLRCSTTEIKTTTTSNQIIGNLIGEDVNNDVTSDNIDSLNNGTYTVTTIKSKL